MSDPFAAVYEEIIHEHYKRPKYRRILEGLPYVENPSCGDRLRVSITLGVRRPDRRRRLRRLGCSISMSSADILAEDIIGKTPEEARQYIETFLAVLRGELDVDELDAFGDAVAFKGVARLPVRVKCAALAWRPRLRSSIL